jgi:hypothetical protein
VRAAPERARTIAVLAAAALLAACDTDVVRLDGKISPTQPKPECVSVPLTNGMVCAYCGSDYSVVRGCLKCVPQSDSPSCMECVWSDQNPPTTCKQCKDESGAVSTLGCTELRDDLKVPST